MEFFGRFSRAATFCFKHAKGKYLKSANKTPEVDENESEDLNQYGLFAFHLQIWNKESVFSFINASSNRSHQYYQPKPREHLSLTSPKIWINPY